MSRPLYLERASLDAAAGLLRTSGIERADELAELLIGTIAAKAEAAARGPRNARRYSQDIDEALQEVTRGLRLHMMSTAVAVALVYRRIEATGLDAFGLRRMPNVKRVRAFVRAKAEELRDMEGQARSQCS